MRLKRRSITGKLSALREIFDEVELAEVGRVSSESMAMREAIAAEDARTELASPSMLFFDEASEISEETFAEYMARTES